MTYHCNPDESQGKANPRFARDSTGWYVCPNCKFMQTTPTFCLNCGYEAGTPMPNPTTLKPLPEIGAWCLACGHPTLVLEEGLITCAYIDCDDPSYTHETLIKLAEAKHNESNPKEANNEGKSK